MLKVSDLAPFGPPAELVQTWNSHVQVLTDVQEKAIRAGALDGQTNLLVVAPTSSGKTFIGELAATSSAFTKRQHAIFIVPFRALADEHYDLFRERYGELLSVVISTSDWSEFDADIRNGSFNLAVMTYEKLMSFMAQQPDLIEQCSTLVVDEVQSISEDERGARLEVLLTQVMLADRAPQIIALSASLDDVNQLDIWLKAKLVSSVERPIPLTQIVCAPDGSGVTLNGDGTTTRQLIAPHADREALVLALCQKFLGEGKQVIVFRTTVPKVVKTARELSGRLPASGPSLQVNERLNELDDSDALADLRRCLTSGVGFHNADLTHPERQVMEDTYRSGEARVLVATTTLAMGVNLPADVVIVADSTRSIAVQGGWSSRNISVSEYRNASGRAGRLGQRTEGLAVLVAEHAIERRQLVNAYLLGPVEPVESQIPKRQFVDVVFGLICAKSLDSEARVFDFISSTFAYQSFYERAGGGAKGVRESIGGAVSKCLDSGLVCLNGEQLLPTQVARVLAGAGLSFRTCTRLAAFVERALIAQPCVQDLIFEVASCIEAGGRPWPQRGPGGVDVDPRPHHAPDGLGCPAGSGLVATIAKTTLSGEEIRGLVRAKCLLEWISGIGERLISAHFQGMGASAARIRDLGKNAAWLLDTVADAGRMRQLPDALLIEIRRTALEARYGVPAPLAPLARLRVPGISREQLLVLYKDPRGAELYEPEAILDVPDENFDGLLTPMQLARLRAAILADIEDSIKRKRAGHVARAVQTSLTQRIVEDLYVASGKGLEQAVTDALNNTGLSAERVLRQPNGEEDVRLARANGTVIISVTASQDDARPIRWNKAKEILGAGAGLNPINYVCVGRPKFESLAERQVTDIAREAGSRSLLLVPMPVFAEAIIRIAEGILDSSQLGDLFACRRGLLSFEDLPRKPESDA